MQSKEINRVADKSFFLWVIFLVWLGSSAIMLWRFEQRNFLSSGVICFGAPERSVALFK